MSEGLDHTQSQEAQRLRADHMSIGNAVEKQDNIVAEREKSSDVMWFLDGKRNLIQKKLDEVKAKQAENPEIWNEVADKYHEEIDAIDTVMGVIHYGPEGIWDKGSELIRVREHQGIKHDDTDGLREKYNANLWESQQHKNDHLDQYIETARQDAEAGGVQINLPMPKE